MNNQVIFQNTNAELRLKKWRITKVMEVMGWLTISIKYFEMI